MAGARLAGLAALAPKRSSGRVSMGLLISLLSGWLVVSLAHFAQSKVRSLTPHYSIWMCPALCLFLASGLGARSRGLRVASVVGIGLLTVADLYGVRRLAIDGDYFAHTSYGAVARLIDRLGPADVAVVYEEAGNESYHIYSPMWYAYGSRVPQYAYESSDAAGKVRVADYPRKKGEQDLATLAFDYLIVVKPKQEGAEELKSQLRQGPLILGDGPVTRSLLSLSPWKRLGERTYPSLVACDVDLFVNTSRKPPIPDDPWEK